MTVILNAEAVQRALSRMAHEIVERNEQLEDLQLVGLQRRGVFIANRLAQKIKEVTGRQIPTGSLDISMYRDDLSLRSAPPTVRDTQIPFNLDEKTVVLVDDVLFTGRTVRAAMDALSDFGRPRRIQFAVLIDRGHRELPIRADYVGKNVPTSLKERIHVSLTETDGADEVSVKKLESTAP